MFLYGNEESGMLFSCSEHQQLMTGLIKYGAAPSLSIPSPDVTRVCFVDDAIVHCLCNYPARYTSHRLYSYSFTSASFSLHQPSIRGCGQASGHHGQVNSCCPARAEKFNALIKSFSVSHEYVHMCAFYRC